MKKYAYYLPQFHVIPENNEWWGDGFTEWTNVKKAIPLIKNHMQPVRPLNDNYYDLSNVNTLIWQAEIANKYNIDGMIFYHYYFCGKKLLEKPAEMLLNNHEIPMNYFFCWANHSWYRSWEGSKTLLIEQEYGNENEWLEHFQYLLPFFRDDRYAKRNNKPLFLIFNSEFEEKDKIIAFFDKKCKEEGFAGIEAIEAVQRYEYKKNENSNLLIHTREPNCCSMFYKYASENLCFRIKNKFLKEMNKLFRFKYIEKFDGDLLLEVAIKNRNKNCIPGLFFEWDNTPRHGYRGYIITPPTKEMFMRYMDSINDSEYVFINAWNEWCEGMMLEPTVEKGYRYLEWIKEWSEKNENRFNGI